MTAERGRETRVDVPAAVSVLTREGIARLPAETLSELLRVNAQRTRQSGGHGSASPSR